MTILALDASSVSCSACVSENGKILAEAFINTALTHSVTLLANIKKVLEQSEKTIEDIDLIAVTAGPGSFTGVKIGVACAKGLAFERDIPCFAVSSLAAAAENVPLWTREEKVFTTPFSKTENVSARTGSRPLTNCLRLCPTPSRLSR